MEQNSDLFARIDDVLPGKKPTPGVSKKFHRGWRARKLVGKPLNMMRLIKAAFTFRGGGDYVASKLDRHTNGALTLTPWERRHPWLAAPWVLIRLLRLRRRS